MADPRWFNDNPALAWGFYGHRLNLYRHTTPHAGFSLLKQWMDARPGGGFVFTSNVDGQFEQAGFDPQRLHACHGSIHHLQCAEPCHDGIWSAHATQVTVDESTFLAVDPLPRCAQCGGLARPNILMFGDWSWLGGRAERERARLQGWLNGLSLSERKTLAVVELGAGEAVATVRHFSESLAASPHVTLIRINPRDCQLPGSRHIALPMGALAALEQIHQAMG
ncbi:putative silent information regulator protein Sir2 [Magnetofaba australis IT-1]|uniref:protein acetyllysine N-acetyltransferase n=2 Tax=Magnetofaba TaxID=1472292 RepID=A0A1Y2JZZ8_9PROT|nr:putative silent information regulator protein Sir2 [Magnetofaba australis IT-1]